MTHLPLHQLQEIVRTNPRARWKHTYHCVACHNEMSQNTMMYSNGRCPYCGHKGRHSATIVECYEVPYVSIDTTKWWQIFQREQRLHIEKNEP